MSNNAPGAWNVPALPRQAPQQFNFIQRLGLRLAGINPAAVIAGPEMPTADVKAPALDMAEPYGATGLFGDLYAWDGSFSPENRDRLVRYKEYENMDTGDIASQIDAITDAVLVSDDNRGMAFKAEAHGNVKINNIIQDLLERTAAQFKVRQILRDLLKYGDVPVAFWFDADDNIVALQKMHPAYMRRRRDRFGRLLGGMEKNVWKTIPGDQIPRAYWQVDPYGGGLGGSERPVGAWLPWQMAWLKWRTDDSYNYSFGSYIEDMRRDWLKLRLMEASMVVARGTRAYPRRVYTLDTSGLSLDAKKKAITDFKEALGIKELHNIDNNSNIVAGTRQRNPMDVDTDIFIATAYKSGPDGKLYPQLNDVKLEDPRIAGLERIPDVEYFRGKHYRRVSPEFMGVARQSNDVTQQDLAADRMFEYIASILEHGLIRPICRLQVMLKGYSLDDKDFTVNFSNDTIKASWRHSDSAFRSSMALSNDITNGVVSIRGHLRDEEHYTEAEIDQTMKEIAAEMDLREQGKLPPLPTKTASGQTPEGGQSKPPNVQQVRKGNKSA